MTTLFDPLLLFCSELGRGLLLLLLLLLAGVLQLLNPDGGVCALNPDGGVGGLNPDLACCAVGLVAALGQDSRRVQELVRQALHP
jgi:hypothetical protein